MTKTLSPRQAANKINQCLDLGLDAAERFPVDVERVALELTPFFNTDPITAVKGDHFASIDGMLARHPNRQEWMIVYNTAIGHPGRINFTLAHELGHYLIHRHTLSTGRIECSERDIFSGNADNTTLEQEANTFAAYLLMPTRDFCEQIHGESFSFDLMSHCADRYDVSLTATVLRWLNVTQQRAVVVLSEDGFMHWSKPSKRALASGRYFATKQHCVPVPELSAATLTRLPAQAREGIQQGSGVWFDEAVMEYSIRLATYGKTLTVLILDDHTGYSDLEDFDEDTEQLTDTYAHFIRHNQTPYS